MESVTFTFELNHSPHLITLGVEVGGCRWEVVAFSVGPELQPKYFPKKPSLFSWCLQGLQNAQDPILYSVYTNGEITHAQSQTNKQPYPVPSHNFENNLSYLAQRSLHIKPHLRGCPHSQIYI